MSRHVYFCDAAPRWLPRSAWTGGFAAAGHPTRGRKEVTAMGALALRQSAKYGGAAPSSQRSACKQRSSRKRKGQSRPASQQPEKESEATGGERCRQGPEASDTCPTLPPRPRRLGPRCACFARRYARPSPRPRTGGRRAPRPRGPRTGRRSTALQRATRGKARGGAAE